MSKINGYCNKFKFQFFIFSLFIFIIKFLYYFIQMQNELYVECYNCDAEGETYHCGNASYPCPLCGMYGDGKGNLLKNYSKKPVEIEYKNHKGKFVKTKFEPPKYKCYVCEDTHKVLRCISSEELGFTNCRLGGSEFEVPCNKCKPEKYQKEYDKQIEKFREQCSNEPVYNCIRCKDKHMIKECIYGKDPMERKINIEFDFYKLPCKDCKNAEYRVQYKEIIEGLMQDYLNKKNQPVNCEACKSN